MPNQSLGGGGGKLFFYIGIFTDRFVGVMLDVYAKPRKVPRPPLIGPFKSMLLEGHNTIAAVATTLTPCGFPQNKPYAE